MLKNDHSFVHAIKVVALAYRLGQQLNLNDNDLVIILTAALLHDIGRVNNSTDTKHGERSVEILDKNIDAIKELMVWHCKGDNRYKGVYKNLLSILKDADALDRVRTNDLDIKKLRHKEAVSLIPFSEKLNQCKSVL